MNFFKNNEPAESNIIPGITDRNRLHEVMQMMCATFMAREDEIYGLINAGCDVDITIPFHPNRPECVKIRMETSNPVCKEFAVSDQGGAQITTW